MRKYIAKTLFFIALQAAIYTQASAADDERFFTFTFENDTFLRKDEGYTNGTGLTLGQAGFSSFGKENVPGWLLPLTRNLSISTAPDKTRGISHMFFQRLQTPEDIEDREFIPDDLLYAGLLAWQGTMYSWDNNVSDQLSLILGVVGPAALGKNTQKFIHKIVGADDPKGWDFQLRNEPVIKVEMQRNWAMYRAAGTRREFEVIGLSSLGIGNLESGIRGGFALRWGTNLSASFGAFTLQADRHVNPLAFTPTNEFYTFIGARAGLIANDLLIEGNTFKTSPSLPLEHIQNEVTGGVAFSRGRWAFVLGLSTFSPRTKISSTRESFGAIGITRRF